MSANHLSPETIGALVDDELSPGELEKVQAHLQQCQSCTLRGLAAYQLKTATKHAAHKYRASPDTLGRLTAQVKQLPPKRTNVISIRSAAWGLIAALLLLTFSLAGLRRANRYEALSTELLDQHLASLSDSSSLEVISTDRHTVKPWFQGKLPFSFNLPEPKALPPGTVLEGADFAYVEGKPAALLVFSIRKHRASVFVTQAGQLPTFPSHITRAGFTVSVVHVDGLELAAVSDANRAELDALVTALANSQ